MILIVKASKPNTLIPEQVQTHENLVEQLRKHKKYADKLTKEKCFLNSQIYII